MTDNLPSSSPADLNLEEAIEKYLARIRSKVAPATAAWRRTHLRSVFLRFVKREGKDYRTVTKSDLERMLLAMDTTQHYKRGIVNTLMDFYDFLKTGDVSARLNNHNPAKGIHVAVREERRLVRVPSVEAVKEAINRLPQVIRRNNRATALRNKLLAELAYGSGLRRIELARLDVGDVDFSAGTVYIIGKGDVSRVVPLTRKALQTAREYLALRGKATGPLLLSERKRRLTVGHVSKLMREKLGMRTHLLRHAFATHLLQEGCNVAHIQAMLGHAKIGTTVIYTHLDKKDLERVLMKTHPRRKRGKTGPL
jgi:integrase/recombinase XerC